MGKATERIIVARLPLGNRAYAHSIFIFWGQHEAIRAEVLAAMAGVYDRQWYVLGEQVAQFEQEYSRFNGVTHTVGVGNGLDALHLALRALGDEVLVSSNGYIATWLAVTHAGEYRCPLSPTRARAT